MVHLRKRSDWFLSPTLGGGGGGTASTGLMQVSQSRSLGDHEGQSPSLIAEFSANPLSHFDSQPASDLPQLCINDSDVSDSGARLAVGENSESQCPANSLSSPSTSMAANFRPSLSSESSPASTKHLLQSDTHYFLVDRFYGSSDKAENGDA